MEDSLLRQRLQERLGLVEGRLVDACRRARRARSEVTLVAVTKTVTAEVARWLPELGILDLGESRPQELWHKAEQLPRAVRWHLIGHVQRNKVARTLPLVRMIHSADSWRLLLAIDAEAERQGRSVEVLLEVNVSGEASKQGFTLAEAGQVAPAAAMLSNIEVTGFMTMAAYQEPEACRPTFAKLRKLRDRLQPLMGPFPQLSMGMSNDFEVAIEEGATLVRLGSVLFEGLET